MNQKCNHKDDEIIITCLHCYESMQSAVKRYRMALSTIMEKETGTETGDFARNQLMDSFYVR